MFYSLQYSVAESTETGTYIPNIGSFINEANKNPPTVASRQIPLKSLLIGNGLTDTCAILTVLRSSPPRL